MCPQATSNALVKTPSPWELAISERGLKVTKCHIQGHPAAFQMFGKASLLQRHKETGQPGYKDGCAESIPLTALQYAEGAEADLTIPSVDSH